MFAQVKMLRCVLMFNIGTVIYTWINGKLCGTDEFENRYYFAKKDKLRGKERRWVMFKGDVEASKVPPEWHAWLHHTSDVPLTEDAAQAKAWQKPHEPNLTGTVGAYRPSGHDVLGGEHAPSSGDYEPWSPS
jgi:NADH:ubiquinone oxidoreductase subunit